MPLFWSSQSGVALALATALHTCAAKVWSAAGRAKPATPLWLGREHCGVPDCS